MFREINERARATVGPFAAPVPPAAHRFVCECGRADCDDYVELSLDDYVHLRDGLDRFAVLAEHAAAGEYVVEREEGYVIVEPTPEGVGG